MKRRLQGSAFLLAATMIWGAAFVAQSVGMDHIGPFTFQAVRCLLAFIGLIPVVWIMDRFKHDGRSFLKRWLDKKLWKAGILCGIPLFLACNLQQIGLVDTDAGKSAFLTAMYIVIVPVISIFLRKKPAVWVPISVVLAVGGLYCLCCAEVSSVSLSDILLLGCAFMFAVQILFVEKFASEVDALRLNTIQALVCGVLSTPFMLFGENVSLASIGQCWLPLAYAGFLSMGAAYSFQILGQKHLESTAASLIMSLESVFAVLFGCLILKEKLSQWEILGCILVFAAVILSQLPDKKKCVA